MHKVTVNEQYQFDIENKHVELLMNNQVVDADLKQINHSTYHIIQQFRSFNAEVLSFDGINKAASIKVNGNIYQVTAKDEFDLLLDQMGLSNINSSKISELKAPMPGLVLKIFVNEGEEVKKGANLLVLEAMKMENIIKSPADGRIKYTKVIPGDKVEKGQLLITFN